MQKVGVSTGDHESRVAPIVAAWTKKSADPNFAGSKEEVDGMVTMVKGEADALGRKRAFFENWSVRQIEYHGKMLEAYSSIYADIRGEIERFEDMEESYEKEAEKRLKEAEDRMKGQTKEKLENELQR